MNYGKKSTARKEKELTSKGTMVRKKFSVIFCKTLFVQESESSKESLILHQI